MAATESAPRANRRALVNIAHDVATAGRVIVFGLLWLTGVLMQAPDVAPAYQDNHQTVSTSSARP